jgi:glycosyltransferase involved in cell wall biosynthesis
MMFVSTLGKPAPNVKIIGPKKFKQMKDLVRDAGIYLATTRETFGIGTLEAMACSVPVVGWNWGGQKEIVIHGETGFLANVRADNRYELLADYIKKAAKQRDVLGANARKDIERRWGWEDRIKQYADIYKRVHAFYNVQRRPKVSVIVTAYNLDKYLNDCLLSVQTQSLEDFECIVLGCPEFENTKKIVAALEDDRFVYMDTPADFGLVGRRNFGLTRAKSLYIRHLDADDMLAPRGLEIEAQALDEHDELHIVYGPMQNMTEDGVQIEDDDGRAQRWAEHEFEWYRQIAHINMIPSTCMARREVYEKSGGYRRRMKKAEDAHFWTLVTSLGFRAAKVTNATTMYHRMREDSKGALEWKADGTDGDWTAWIPWRAGPASNPEGFKYFKQKGKQIPHPELVPFGCVGTPPKGFKSWQVHDYAYPIVSVMVTVGPGHEKYLVDALDSVRAQNYPDWECVVINDTGKEWSQNYWDSPLSGFPFAKYVSTGGNYGVSRARNIGAQVANGKLFVWMDADDYWLPWFLEKMVASYEANRGIIYSDLFIVKPGEDKEKLDIYQEFNCNRLPYTGVYAGSSVIIPREVHQAVLENQGGWDEDIPGQEDWDYQLACHAYTGTCAFRVEEPLFFYRYLPDGNREKHIQKKDAIVEYMDKKWSEYRTGAKKIMCGCAQKRVNVVPSTRMMSSSPALQNVTKEDFASVSESMVLVEYHGPHQAAVTIKGPVTRQNYRFGLQPSHKIKKVFTADAKVFLAKRNQDSSAEFTLYQPDRLPHEIREFLNK